MILKRSEIIKENAIILLNNPDGYFNVDAYGRLNIASSWNLLGRFINWLYDPKGLLVQNAVLKTIEVMKEKFEKLVKNKQDIEDRLIALKSQSKETSYEKAYDLWKKITQRGTIAIEIECDEIPEHLKSFRLMERTCKWQVTDKQGNKCDKICIQMSILYPEMASYIASLPQFSKIQTISDAANALRKYAVNLDWPVTAIYQTPTL